MIKSIAKLTIIFTIICTLMAAVSSIEVNAAAPTICTNTSTIPEWTGLLDIIDSNWRNQTYLVIKDQYNDWHVFHANLTTTLTSYPHPDGSVMTNKGWNIAYYSSGEAYVGYNTYGTKPLRHINLTTPSAIETWAVGQPNNYGDDGIGGWVDVTNGCIAYSNLVGSIHAPSYTETPAPAGTSEAPTINYNIQGQTGTFVASENIDETHVKYIITYGSIEGNPQLFTWESNEIPIENNTFTFDFPYIATADQENIFGTYNIQAYYTDGNDEIVSEITSILVTLKENQINQFVGSCSANDCETTPISNEAISTDINEYCSFSETFPYIAFGDCISQIKKIINILSFEKINLGNDFVQGEAECRSLVVFDKWLNLETGYEICPLIPEDVRNIVTPFMTFGLGLMAISFLGNKAKEDTE